MVLSLPSRIVLDILGADPNFDPEPLSSVSLESETRKWSLWTS